MDEIEKLSAEELALKSSNVPDYYKKGIVNKYVEVIVGKDEQFKFKVSISAFSNFLIKELKIFSFQKTIYFWYEKEKTFEGTHLILRKIIDDIYPHFKIQEMKEVIAKIEYRCKEEEREMNIYAIKFKNIVWDAKEMKVIEGSPFYLNSLNYVFDLEKLSEPEKLPAYKEVNDFLKSMSYGDKFYKRQIIWSFAKALIPSTKNGKATIIYGPAGTGKSTLVYLLLNVLGYKNWADLKFEILNNIRGPIKAIGKMAIYGDENNEGEFVKDISNFKSSVQGQPITYQELFKDFGTCSLYAKQYFSFNNPLKIYQKDIEAFEDRIEMLFFPKKHRTNDVNERKDIKEKCKTDKDWAEAFLYMMLKELPYFIKNNEIIPVAKMSELGWKKWTKEGNKLKAFIDSLKREDVVNKRLSEIVEKYLEFHDEDSVDNEERYLSRNLSILIKKTFKLTIKQKSERISGYTNPIKYRIFAEEGESDIDMQINKLIESGGN